MSEKPTVRILGTHGVPANYGGFETAAENVAKYLVANGWRVVVYCQVEGVGHLYEDIWEGIERVNIPVPNEGWIGTSRFDLISIKHASQFKDVCLTFGYNTAIFNVWQRVKRIPNVINMDGIEWSRERWGKLRQAILYTNERIACYVGNTLIADHPDIHTYLLTRAAGRKIETITYGAHPIADVGSSACAAHDVTPGKYLTLIARPIPENSILEIVKGFTARERDVDLLILGNYNPAKDDYHAAVVNAANDRVKFPGGIYDPEVVQQLRFNSIGYLHGHTVGGTNPSLVEALAAGNPVIAHKNPYNQWVAKGAALYFSDSLQVDQALTRLINDPDLAAQMGAAAKSRHLEEFTWEHVAGQYEAVLNRYVKFADRDSISGAKRGNGTE